MTRPAMILTGPQALSIGALALLAWSIRVPLARLARLAYWGPDFMRSADDADDWVDFVGANPDLFLDPLPTEGTVTR